MDVFALDELPGSYRLALRLRALGADDELIAECLGIDARSVDLLLQIGARKLENAQRAGRSEPLQDVSGPASLADEDFHDNSVEGVSRKSVLGTESSGPSCS
jgi:hypothetical protein